jgi:hypothetical protein
MHQGVDQPEEGTVAGRQISKAEPEVDGHDGVMVDVKQRHLAEFLPGDEAKLKF